MTKQFVILYNIRSLSNIPPPPPVGKICDVLFTAETTSSMNQFYYHHFSSPKSSYRFLNYLKSIQNMYLVK